MLKPISKTFRGLITITGPTKSGKSQFAEFLINEHKSITYIATAIPRLNDAEWETRINIHKKRRPKCWKLLEHPLNICKEIESMHRDESILIDSLGGLVEQHLTNEEDQWQLFQENFINCLINTDLAIIVVSEEIGWGIVPSTPMGHLFRERLSNLSLLLSRHAKRKWLAVHGTIIDLDKVGDKIP